MLNTPLLQTLLQILSFNSADEHCYFMKLEALWTLQDLSYFDTVTTMRLLSSSLNPGDLGCNER